MRLARRQRSPLGGNNQPELTDDLWSLRFDLHPRTAWIVDASTGRFLAVNGAAIALYGFDVDEFLMMRANDPRLSWS